MVRTLASSALLLALGAAAAPLEQRAASCSGTFTQVTAQDWFNGANPGWNLGNTLDATPTEGSWNNPPVVNSTFQDVKAAGFKSVRLPVTWQNHFVGGTDNTGASPDWTVDPTWLARINTVVDSTIALGLYTIVNVHHDATGWADVTASGANYTQIEEKFYRLWYQIGATLACKSSLLAFEPINEPPASTQAHYDEINKLNTIFLQALADSGGFNPKRVVTLVGPSEDSILTSEYFKAPSSNFTNPWGIQYHYYSPYSYIFSAWGATIWGSAADQAAMEGDIANIRGNFTDVPLIIGEYGASTSNTERASSRKYTDFLVRTAKKYNTQTITWDNGGDFFNRAANVWYDPSYPSIITNAAVGTNNSLADSTEDLTATSQFTSAYVFQKVGAAVTAQSLPWLFNGNTYKSATNEKGSSISGSNIKASGSNVTFSQSLLKTYFTSSAKPGILGNWTLNFSKGSSQAVQPVLWDTPVLASNSSQAVSGATVQIPITWKGIAKVAAVKGISSDGSILIDNWTQYLGPTQAGRETYNNDYTWDANSVSLTGTVSSAVVSAGKTTTFTFEFFPRVPGNSVNYTLTA